MGNELRHELHHEVAVLDRVVVRHQHVSVLGIKANQDVNVPVIFDAHIARPTQ
jgi:hypothetical protein